MGFRKDIEDSDVYEIGKNYRSQLHGGLLEQQWEKEILKSHPSILKPIVKIFGPTYLILMFISMCIGFSLL